MYLSKYLSIIGVFILSLGLVIGCSDNALDEGSSGESPDIPDLSQHEPEISYFQNNNPGNDNKYSNFNMASLMVTSTSAALTAGLQLATNWLTLAQSSEADQSDGEWIWEYSHTYEGESVSVRLVAEEVNDNEIKWELYISGTYSDGESFDNYKFMEGTVATDGENGNWKVYPYEPGQNTTAASTFEWQVTSETEKELNFTDYTDQEWDTRLNHNEQVPEYTITIETNDDEPSSEVYWNTDEGTGYVIQDGEQMCWDANFENTPCE